MGQKIRSLLIILTLVIISCKDQNIQNELPGSEQSNGVNDEKSAAKLDTVDVDKIKITEQLQGKWREHEYPYRTAEFSNTTVKFVEEGIEGTPKFEKFEIGQDCPFDNNNIKALTAENTILILPEQKRCEKITVSNDTLILSGYSTHTNKDYNIIYLNVNSSR